MGIRQWYNENKDMFDPNLPTERGKRWNSRTWNSRTWTVGILFVVICLVLVVLPWPWTEVDTSMVEVTI